MVLSRKEPPIIGRNQGPVWPLSRFYVVKITREPILK
jgi:hypothetical protein